MAAQFCGRYRVEAVRRVEPLGQILVATLPEVNRPVLLRVLCPPEVLSAEERARLVEGFEAEWRRLAGTTDPRLLRPVDAGALPKEGRFVAFECLEASGWQSPPREPGTWRADTWLRVGAEAGEALASLLEAGIPLLRFEPDALFISRIGEVRYVPLEFGGLARACGLAPFAPLEPAWSAPELFAGRDAGPAAVVFSLATWLYAALSGTGRSPAPAILAGEIPEPLWVRNPAVRAATDDLIRAAMSRNPEARPPHPRAFAAALRRLAEGASPAEPTLRLPRTDASAPHDFAPSHVPEAVAPMPEPTIHWAPAPPSEPTLQWSPADPSEPTLPPGAVERWPAAGELALWAVGLALAGSAAGWTLARLLGAP